MSQSEKRVSGFVRHREQIIEMLRTDAEVRVSEVERATGAKRATAHRWLVRAKKELEQARVSPEVAEKQADVSVDTEVGQADVPGDGARAVGQLHVVRA